MSLKSIKTWIGGKGDALPAGSAYKRGQINLEHPSSGRDKPNIVLRNASNGYDQMELAMSTDVSDAFALVAADIAALQAADSLFSITSTIGPFYAFDTAISTTVQMGMHEPTASATQAVTIADLYMQRSGRVVGMYLNSNANRTAGIATGTVYLNGVSTPFDGGGCALSAGAPRRHGDVVSFASGVAFTSGDRIGMGISTDASWAPVTADFSGRLIVAYTPF